MKGYRTRLTNLFFAFLGAAPLLAQPLDKVDTLSASVIVANHDRAVLSGLTSLDGSRLRAGVSLLGVPDIVRSLKMLPGVAAGMEITAGLYVHGGDGSDNLFLLDGVPLFQVAHLGGMLSSFNTEAIAALDFYKSGFPARFGGRLSSVVDIVSESGDYQNYHGSVSVGLLDGQVAVGGPVVKDRLSFHVALRRSWPDLVLSPVLSIRNAHNQKKTTGLYYMYDVNLALNWSLSPIDEIRVRLYQGKDHFRYSTSLSEKFYGKQIYEEESYTRLRMDWGNFALSSSWRHFFSAGAPFEARVYYSRGFSDIGYGTRSASMRGDHPKENTFEGQDVGDVARMGMGVRQMVYLNRHRLEFGVDYQNTKFFFPNSAAESRNGGVFLEDKILLGLIQVVGGLRMDAYAFESNFLFKPQPRAKISCRVTPDLVLNASYTTMVQFAHLLTSVLLDLPTNRWGPSSAALPPSEACQATLGFDYSPSAQLSVRGEAYYKSMDNLFMYTGTTTLFPPADCSEREFACGRGRAYGVDLEGKFCTDRSESVLNYSLSWSQRYFEEIFNDWFFDRYDNRHKISFRHTQRFGEKIRLTLTWDYHSGNRVTFPEQIVKDGQGITFLYSSPNNMRMPAWHRLDLSCEVRSVTKKGHESLWAFGLCNVYGRKNPLVVMLADMESNPGYYYLKGYSLPPLIPSVSYTYKF